MYLPVTTWLACGLAALHLALSVRVIRLRYATRTSLGDGADPSLTRAIRGQANLSEYAPIFLILTFLAEMQGAQVMALGVLAGAFFVGRAMHGICFGFMAESPSLRGGGMVLTFVTLAAMIIFDLLLLVI